MDRGPNTTIVNSVPDSTPIIRNGRMNIKGKIFDVKTRRWLYRIGIAAGALLVAYGIVDENVIGLWGVLFAAILGLADVNAGDAGAEDREV